MRVQQHFQQYFTYNVHYGSQFYWWRKPGVSGENHRAVAGALYFPQFKTNF